MIKIMKELWNLNEGKLRASLANRTDLDDISYEELIKLTFDKIFDTIDYSRMFGSLDTEHITVIDNGDYSGTLIILVPFDTYTPDESDYLMTYVGYGSCSYCDALQHAQDHWRWDYTKDEDGKNARISCFMSICKDIICNTIKPYNYGWRHSELFDTVVEEIA